MDVRESSLEQKPAFAVVLLHGLMADSNELDPIAAKLRNSFGDLVLIIQPTSRVGRKSLIHSTNSQAKDIFKLIQSEFLRYNKDVHSFPLIVIGYSHGGVLACTLGNIYKCQSNQLNICGIIVMNSPLTGTPILQRSHADVQKFISSAQEGLNLIRTSSLSSIRRIMKVQAFGLTLMRSRWMPIPWVNGLKDILPDSACIRAVYNFLRNTSHNIPCLLIASYQTDFGELFSKKKPEHEEAIKELNDSYSQFVTGDKIGKHDTLIPLSSQLCRGNSFTDLVTDADTNDPVIMPMPKQSNVEAHIYKDIIHAANLIAIDADLFVPNNEVVICSQRILTDLVQFVEKQISMSMKPRDM